MQRALAQFIANSTGDTCLLVVHPDVRTLSAAVRSIAAEHGWPVISVGADLSQALLDVHPGSRPRTARRWLTDIMARSSPGPVVLADTDLLFEPELQLDPLALVQIVSRTTRIVFAWPGAYKDGFLAYAVPEHSAYRTWTRPKVPIEIAM